MTNECPMNAPDPGAELKFPLMCHYKVIAENREGMHFVIETVLQELGVKAPLETGNMSANGKYITFMVSIAVDSRKTMNAVDQELRNIVGVKMVL